MPKIVDHEAYRLELASRAIGVFREFGYHALGMRQIADELGVSKSALYHYFPSKKALFDTCSRLVTDVPVPSLMEDATTEDRHRALVSWAMLLDAEFVGELSLLVDYVRPLSRDEVRDNEALRRSLRAFETSVAGIVGEQNAPAALNQLLGILVRRVFDGGATGFESLRRYC